MSDVVTSLLEAEARRDVPAMAELLAEDMVFEMPFGEQVTVVEGRQAMTDLLSRFLGGFYAEFTLRDIEVTAAATSGRYFAEYRSTGRVASNGHAYHQRYAAVLEVSDGKVVLWREYFNPLPLRDALAS
ncbi:nuclear transport factor 2 family protein [Streptosporangium sp. NPDC020072]|uniref:nuclear transport factor 2 family protein n=1 Tax=Streptosporangium sp. NPDC020072 TaxID=3154788 RepID=UPI0034236CE9